MEANDFYAGGHHMSSSSSSCVNRSCGADMKAEVRSTTTERAIDALRASVWWMCPRSFMSATCAGMGTLDPAEEIAYWKTVLAVEAGVPMESLTCSGPNTPKRWRRIFYDFEITPKRLCETADDYRQLFKQELVVLPQALLYENDATCLIDSGGNGDRCVVANQFVPGACSATLGTPHPVTGKYKLDYRRQYYYEIRALPNDAHRGPVHRPPCFSIGFSSARTDLERLATKQAGWCVNTWGLHSDDGNVFAGSGQSEQHFCKPFGAGQCVGAGILFDGKSRAVFFTLDGVFIGLAAEITLPLEGTLVPSVGVDGRWDLEFNFGQKPFHYDEANGFDQQGLDDISPRDCAFLHEQESLPSRFSHHGDYMDNMGLTPPLTECYSMDADAVSPRTYHLESPEEGVKYGPVWPWQQPASIRPKGHHFNPRKFLGSWVYSFADRWNRRPRAVLVRMGFDGGGETDTDEEEDFDDEDSISVGEHDDLFPDLDHFTDEDMDGDFVDEDLEGDAEEIVGRLFGDSESDFSGDDFIGHF